MSKPETSIISVPLANAYLNLNQEKDTVRQYEGFNKLNAPYYGGNLTPLWRKFLGSAGSSSYTDDDENVYKLADGVFTKTDKLGNVTTLKDDFQEYTATEKVLNDKTYKWYYDDNNKVIVTDTGYFTIILNGITVSTIADFQSMLFDSDRAVLVTSTDAQFFFQGENVLTVTLETEKAITPTYTIYDTVMVVSVNNKLYGFKANGTVSELTVNYNGDVTVTYGATRLNCEVPDESSEGRFRNYIESADVTLNLNEIADNTTLNGEQGEQYDHSDDQKGTIYAYIKAWQINTNSTYFEWLYNGTHDFDKETLSGFILSPSKSTVMFPSTLCITSECLGNMAAGYSVGPSAGLKNYIALMNSLVKYYNIYNVTNAEISAIDDDSITISVTAEKKTTLSCYTPTETGYYEIRVYYTSPTFGPSGGFTCYYHTENVASIDNAYSLLAEYKNKFTYEISDRTNTVIINGDRFLGEIKKETSDITLIDYPLSSRFGSEAPAITSNYEDSMYCNEVSFVANPEDYNLSTTLGYAVNFSDHFRLLVNSGEIQAISCFNDANCLGSLVSNFATTGIDCVYVTDDGLIYVDDTNKVHVITLVKFADSGKMTVLLGRYFVFNAVGVNCYDLQNSTWNRIGVDWNNRFIIADYSESEDTKYYMTSAMYRTTDNTPTLSMIFGTDYFNAIPVAALIPQYAQDATIQLYGTESANEDVLYLNSFVYSNSAWSKITESAYEGMVAEVFSDDNLLIPVSIMTQFVTSYLNDIYAVIYNGFSPLYKSANASSIIKFNFYLGTLITDLGLDALFILQGQYYRLSNKIIYAYTYTSGTLTDTQEICNVGSLSFVGASPSEAYFWSYGNRTLYRFTGARTVEAVLCADSINSIYATLYDTTTSSLYMSTDLGLVVYNSFGNFILEDVKMATSLTSTKLGITYQDENGDIYGLYYNAADGNEVIPIEFETAYFGSSDVQNVISDTLYLKLFNKDSLSEGTVTFTGYVQNNYGATKELVTKTVKVIASQFDEITKNLLLRYQPDQQRGIGISWKVTSDFPISYIGIGAGQTTELNMPKGNNPVMTAQKYNF